MGTLLLIIALVLAAAVFFALEIVTPSFGLLFTGAVAMLAIAVWQGWGIHRHLGMTMIGLLAIGSVLYLNAMVKYLPNTKFGGKIFLQRIVHKAGEGTPKSKDHALLVGKLGKTVTLLRPAGIILVDGKRVDALSESGIISRQTAIEVVRSEGMAVIVKAIDKKRAEV